MLFGPCRARSPRVYLSRRWGGGSVSSSDRVSTPSTLSGSGESNLNIDTRAVQASALTNRKHKLWNVQEEEVVSICARTIGQGHVFCTLKTVPKNIVVKRDCVRLFQERHTSNGIVRRYLCGRLL